MIRLFSPWCCQLIVTRESLIQLYNAALFTECGVSCLGNYWHTYSTTNASSAWLTNTIRPARAPKHNHSGWQKGSTLITLRFIRWHGDNWLICVIWRMASSLILILKLRERLILRLIKINKYGVLQGTVIYIIHIQDEVCNYEFWTHDDIISGYNS